MKKYIAFIPMLLLMFAVQAQTADAVINQYLAAAGGKEKLQAITTLQYVQTINLTTPMGEMQVMMTNIKVQDKLFRMNTSSEMFGTAFTVVTDTSGWIMMPANQFTGSEAKLEKMEPAQQKSLQPMWNCEGFFPELVNYAAKGYTAELQGETKVNGAVCYKLKLKKDKDERIYCINKATGLVASMTMKGLAALAASGMGSTGMGRNSGKADKFELTFNYSDYKDVSGVKIPGKMSIDTQMGKVEATIGFVSINKPVDPKWYKPAM